jgi:hypothetical protein
VSHALQVRRALQSDNYHRFFALYRDTPNMGTCILDLMIDTWRVQALQRMCKAYKPSISASFVINELAFDSSAVALEFFRKAGCILAVATASKSSDNGGSAGDNDDFIDSLEINTKDSVVDFSAVFTADKLLL